MFMSPIQYWLVWNYPREVMGVSVQQYFLRLTQC
jgi:hypothetical protein